MAQKMPSSLQDVLAMRARRAEERRERLQSLGNPDPFRDEARSAHVVHVPNVAARTYTTSVTAPLNLRRASRASALRPPLKGGRVSVLIPAYKTPLLLRRAVESVLNQDLPSGWASEIWVGVDACAETRAAAEALHDEHPEVRIVDFAVNGGPYRVLNALFDLSTGEVISILDSDDAMLPGKLSKQLQELQSYDFVGSLYSISEGGAQRPGPPCVEFPSLSRLGFPIHSSWAVRRGVYEQLGAYRGWRCGADTDFYVRALALRARVRVLQEPLFVRGVRPNQLTSPGTSTGPGSAERVKAQRNVQLGLEAYRNGAAPPRTNGARARADRVIRSSPRVVALMPSIPKRQRSAQLVLKNLLAQGVDKVVVFLNGHRDVPSWTRHPRVDVRRNPPGTGPIARWHDPPESDIVLGVDDDLIYPKDYVERTVRHLLRVGRGRFLSYHCSHWPPGAYDLDDRVILGFSQGSSLYVPKTYMGSGASAFFTSDLLRVERDDVPAMFHRLDDVWMSAATARAGLLLYRPPSPSRWIGTYPEQEDGIFKSEVQERFFSRRRAIASARALGSWKLTPTHSPLKAT